MFWEIEIFEHHFDIREGIGTRVTRSRQWDFKTPGRARAEYRKHIEWHERGGFTLVYSDVRDDDIVNLALVELRGDVNLEIEAAIREQPDSLDAWLVYGDWLESQGSERGELVQVQAALAIRPEDQALKEREETLIADHERAWLGDLADSHSLSFRCSWKLGFVETAELSGDLLDTASACRSLESLAAARLLRALTLRIWGGGAEPLAVANLLTPYPILRELTIEAEVDLGLENADEVASRTLEALVLRARQVRIGRSSLPALRRLELTFGAIDVEANELLVPSLEVLSLTFDRAAESAPPTVAAVASFVRSVVERGERLHSLTMRVPSWGDELIAMLAERQEVARRLLLLDLCGAAVTDAGAAMLIAHARAFQHIVFDLRYNQLGPDRASELARRFERIQIDTQHEVPPWRRTENEYDDVDE